MVLYWKIGRFSLLNQSGSILGIPTDLCPNIGLLIQKIKIRENYNFFYKNIKFLKLLIVIKIEKKKLKINS